MTTDRPTRPAAPLLAVLILLAVASPLPGHAVTPNRSLEGSLLIEPGSGRTGGRLSAATWLEGEVEVVAALSWWSASRTGGRGAGGALEPAVGLRWALDRPGWRPEAGAEVLCRAQAGAWRSAALGVALRAGLEWLPSRALGIGLGAGLRWTAAGPPELVLSAAARIYF